MPKSPKTPSKASHQRLPISISQIPLPPMNLASSPEANSFKKSYQGSPFPKSSDHKGSNDSYQKNKSSKSTSHEKVVSHDQKSDSSKSSCKMIHDQENKRLSFGASNDQDKGKNTSPALCIKSSYQDNGQSKASKKSYKLDHKDNKSTQHKRKYNKMSDLSSDDDDDSALNSSRIDREDRCSRSESLSPPLISWNRTKPLLNTPERHLPLLDTPDEPYSDSDTSDRSLSRLRQDSSIPVSAYHHSSNAKKSPRGSFDQGTKLGKQNETSLFEKHFPSDRESKESTPQKMDVNNRHSYNSPRLSSESPSIVVQSYYSRRKSLPAINNSTSYDTPNATKTRWSITSMHTPSPRKPYERCMTDQTPYSPLQRKRARFTLPSYDASELQSLKTEHGFVDSHCHLDFLFNRNGFDGTYGEFQKENKETFPVSYEGCLAIFCNPFTFPKVDMWSAYLKEENVWASFGCHPHNAADYTDEVERQLCAALEHAKVRALGEIGLDYSNRNNCQKDVQFRVLRRQLKIALMKELPVVIHCREAHEDAIKIIKEVLPTDYKIHLHCFTDTWSWAEKWLGEFPNLFIGLTNVVTFPSAESVHEVARNISLKRLLLETDTPYFIPRPVAKTTRFSHPGMAIHVAAQVAALRNISIDNVLKHTRKNTKSMYNI